MMTAEITVFESEQRTLLEDDDAGRAALAELEREEWPGILPWHWDETVAQADMRFKVLTLVRQWLREPNSPSAT